MVDPALMRGPGWVRCCICGELHIHPYEGLHRTADGDLEDVCAWPCAIDIETDDERDDRFAPLNDRIWGAGNWIRCSTCPPDSLGRQPYHHRQAHD